MDCCQTAPIKRLGSTSSLSFIIPRKDKNHVTQCLQMSHTITAHLKTFWWWWWWWWWWWCVCVCVWGGGGGGGGYITMINLRCCKNKNMYIRTPYIRHPNIRKFLSIIRMDLAWDGRFHCVRTCISGNLHFLIWTGICGTKWLKQLQQKLAVALGVSGHHI